MGGGYRRVDIVLNALSTRDLGDALALLLFALNSRLPRILNREHSPGARQRALEGGRVVQIAGDDLGPELRNLAGGRGVRLARHRAHFVTLGEQFARGRPALLAGGASDDDQIASGFHVVPLPR